MAEDFDFNTVGPTSAQNSALDDVLQESPRPTEAQIKAEEEEVRVEEAPENWIQTDQEPPIVAFRWVKKNGGNWESLFVVAPGSPLTPRQRMLLSRALRVGLARHTRGASFEHARKVRLQNIEKQKEVERALERSRSQGAVRE